MKFHMKKNRIRFFSLLLALLMVVTSVPFPTHTDIKTFAETLAQDTKKTEYSKASPSKADKICSYCGVVNCEEDHLVCGDCKNDPYTCKEIRVASPSVADEKCEFCGKLNCKKEHTICDICEKLDCKKTHKYCDVCDKYDCKKTHMYCEACDIYDCKEHKMLSFSIGPVTSTGPTEEPMVGKKVTLVEKQSYFIYQNPPAMSAIVGSDAFPEIMEIADVYSSGNQVFYKLIAANGKTWLPDSFGRIYEGYYLDSTNVKLVEEENNDLDVSAIWDSVYNENEIKTGFIGFIDDSIEELVFIEGEYQNGDEYLVASASNCPKYFILETEYWDEMDEPLLYKVRSYDEGFCDEVDRDYWYLQAEVFSDVVQAKGLYATLKEDEEITLWADLDEATNVYFAEAGVLANEYEVEEMILSDAEGTGNEQWYVKLVPDEEWMEGKEIYVWTRANAVEELKLVSDNESSSDNEIREISVSLDEREILVSGIGIPEKAKLAAKEAFKMDGGFAFDVKIIDDYSEWQPIGLTKVKVTISVPEVEDGNMIDIIHYLEDEQSILDAVEKGNVLTEEWVEELFSDASQAYKAVTEESGCVAYEVFSVEVLDGSVSFETSGFSIYTWNGSSYSKSTTGDSAKIVFHETLTSGSANGSTYYVTANHSIYCDRGGIAAVNRQWRYSSGAPVTANKELEGANGAEIRFAVNSSARPGTTFYIECKIWQGLGWTDWSRVNFVVVEERTVNYNANGGSAPVSSNVAITDGGTHNQNVTLPNATRTGYNFLGWYTAASGGTREGGYGTPYMPAKNGTTLYAQWSPITYTIKYHANGGTGTMSDQTMTYNQSAKFNMNQFTHPTAGYTFAGWATSSTGAVAYKNGAEVSNLTNTQGDVINLYAVWVNTMELEDVRVGINECYWFTDYMYTVTSDNVASSSYHAFPNEPAQQSIRYSRAVDDANGTWSIVLDGTLYGKASAYIDPSIVKSEKFIHSYIINQDTWGVSDSTGVDTKEFLKFDSNDYLEMIEKWLVSMAERTSDTPNDDGTYTIKNKDVSYKTDVNWNEEVGNAANYEMIPYVIKLENSNAWRVDMVAVPSRYVTLTYDLNINTEAGYSLTAGSSIPNAQYERDTIKDVYLSPTAYNPNTKVSKNAGGQEYVAEFLYWLDEQGNKYGSGYKTTIKMDGNKSLKAVWNYTDQSVGALHVGKDVIVAAGSGLTPDGTTEFSINVAMTGSYPYTKYNAKGISAGTGNTVSGTTTFSLKDGEYVTINNIPKATSYTVTETLPSGFSNRSGTINGSIQAGNTVYATVVNEKSYKVALNNMGADSGKEGTKEYYYLYKTTLTQDGGLIYYYTDSACTTPFENGTGVQKYYTIVCPEKTGYIFDGYYDSTDFAAATQYVTDQGMCINNIWDNVAADSALYAKWTPITFSVRGTIDNGGLVENGSQTVNYGGKSDAMTFTPATGYKITEIKVNNVAQEITDDAAYTYPAQNTVTRDISVVIKTTKRTYSVTGTIDKGTVTNGEQTVAYGGSSKEMVFKAASGYEITELKENGVTKTISACDTYTYPVKTNITDSIVVEVTTSVKGFSVTGHIDNGGTVTNENQRVEYGQKSAAMVFTPAIGFEIVSITVNGVEQTVENTFSYIYPIQENVTGNIHVKVTTAKKIYSVTGTIDNGGTVTNGNQKVAYGEKSAEMIFTPNDGYKIISVTIDGVTQSDFTDQSYTYAAQTNVMKSIHVVVTTERALADLTIEITGANTGKTYIFNVKDENGSLVTKVILTNAKKRIVVKNLPVGDYVVIPQEKWTWRQLFAAETNGAVTLDTSKTVTYTCSFNSALTRWLNGYSYNKKEKGGSN